MDFSAADDRKVDAEHRYIFARLAHADMCGLPGSHFIAIDELTLYNEGVLAVIKDCVEIDDALAELRQIACSHSGVPDIIGRAIRLQRIHIAGGVERHKVAEYGLLPVR